MQYQITSPAGVDHGRWEGASPAEALLALLREAGYGPDVVTLDPDDPHRLRFVDDGQSPTYRELCGDVGDWVIREVVDAAR